MRNTRAAAAAAVLTTSAMLLAAGCAGTTPGGSGTSGGDGVGPFTLAMGKDTTGKLQTKVLDLWNKKHPDQKVTLIELPESADEQRAAMVQNFQAKSDRFDVVAADVVWTAEFAARKWIQKLDASKLPVADLLPAAVETAKYKGDLYAAPMASAGALLFYRKDLVSKPPTTWKDLLDNCAVAEKNHMDCYAGQFAQYEGLTVNASEAINSAGGSVYGPDGSVTVNSPEAKAGLDFLVDGFSKGYIPKEAITYKEEDGRRAFQKGDLLFFRSWPYVYGLANAKGSDTVIAGKVGVAPIPGAKGVGASTLGGANLALSSYSKHKKSVLDFMTFMESPEVQRVQVEDLSNAPVLTELYTDKTLAAKFPYLPTLRQSLLNARPRPQVPAYNDTSLRIQQEIYKALQGKKSSAAALKDLADQLGKIENP
ncbi:ABC transporter substrate-binding protein [Streptomyces sp.]|uniref:ABC transporter substrate-binding protein n=1 Tax=Streptomyces sp. TaxID=1931 RepID=UPI002D775E53|nr:ABC transporter substrate-binding protein [Streptomyces sp.]HET6356423.1 ABC transporter substrate-binding protein [Streptomyces sp.]